MHYTLLKASADDFDLIYNLKKISVQPYVEKIWGWDEQYQLNDFKSDFKNIDEFSVILVENDKIGFLQVIATQCTISIVEIHLLASFRGKGIGTSIIKSLIEQARTNNKNISLGCFKYNIRAKELYLKIGFKLVVETESHYKFELVN